MSEKRLQRLEAAPGTPWNRITRTAGELTPSMLGVYDADGCLLRTALVAQDGTIAKPLSLEVGQTVYVAFDAPNLTDPHASAGS